MPLSILSIRLGSLGTLNPSFVSLFPFVQFQDYLHRQDVAYRGKYTKPAIPFSFSAFYLITAGKVFRAWYRY